jgi:beta-glucosidase
MDPIEEKAEAIVKKLSLKQKTKLLYGAGDWATNPIKKKSIRSISMHDGPSGLRIPQPNKNPENGEFVGDSIPSTCYPAPCLTACSWDPELLKEMGQSLGRECVEQKTDIILAPGVNIKRNPLCGRNFEYLSEDPLLAGKMAAGFITGVQSQGVGVSLKHFACNNQEYRRFNYSAEVDQRALREIYLKPFEIAIKEANPWTVMCSYNKINGVYSSDNDWLLKDVLRKEWGYDGVVMSDWGATVSPIDSHNHGLDLEMPCHEKRASRLARAVKRGKLKSAAVDEEALHMVTLNLRCQNHPVFKDAFNLGMGHQTALKVAEKSIVLAKNCGDILPLANFDDVCLIGALAKQFRYQGGGSSHVNPGHLVTLYDAMNEGRAPGKEVKFEPGYSLGGNESEKLLRLNAVDLASSHKNVVVCLGLPEVYESEGYDRHDMRLPEEQYALVDSLLAVNSNLIVVLLCGSPVELPFLEKVPAVIIAYLSGEGGGKAISEILLGSVNPSGKLAETWPLHYLDVPNKDFYPGSAELSQYRESIFVGYRFYCTANKNVLFPFGHGLSYSEFKYSDFELSKEQLKSGSSLKVSLKVTNAGKLDGDEVVELYVSPQNNKIFKPVRELRAFVKVSLGSKKSKAINFTLPYSAFSYFDPSTGEDEVENGQYLIEIGASCGDIRLSGLVEVVSSFVGIDRRSSFPSYYNVGREYGFTRTSDEELTRLAGRPLSLERDGHRRPYTMNSTLEEISDTFIGRKIKKNIEKMSYSPKKTEQQNQDYLRMMMDSPIRMAGMAGLTEKKCLALLAMANGHLFGAFFALLFGHRK